MRVLNGAVLAAVIGALAACASEPTKPTKLAKPTCAHVGQRLGGTPIKGSIIGGLGTRVELQACPYAWVHIAFVGETPADYMPGILTIDEVRRELNDDVHGLGLGFRDEHAIQMLAKAFVQVQARRR